MPCTITRSGPSPTCWLVQPDAAGQNRLGHLQSSIRGSFHVAERAQSLHHRRLLLGLQLDAGRPPERGSGRRRAGTLARRLAVQLSRLEDGSGIRRPAMSSGIGEPEAGGARSGAMSTIDSSATDARRRRMPGPAARKIPSQRWCPRGCSRRATIASEGRIDIVPPSASTIDRSGPSSSNGPANACSRVHSSCDQRPAALRVAKLQQRRRQLDRDLRPDVLGQRIVGAGDLLDDVDPLAATASRRRRASGTSRRR